MEEDLSSVVGNSLILIVGFLQAIYYGLILVIVDSEHYSTPGTEHSCPICLDEMVPNSSFFPSYLVGHTSSSDKVLFFGAFVDEMTSNHVFHESCLKKCLTRDPELPSCPLCRKLVVDNRDVAFDIFCKMNESAQNANSIPPLLSLISNYSAPEKVIAAEQYFLQIFATKNVELLLENFVPLNKLIPNFQQYYRYYWKVFSFETANLSLFLGWPVEIQFSLVKEAYKSENFDAFCRLFDCMDCLVNSKESFLIDLINAEISVPSMSIFKLVLLFERLSLDKKLQIKSKIFSAAIRNKNIEFLIKFLLFYDSYPDNSDSLIRSFISKQLKYLFQLEPFNLCSLFNILLKEYPELNTLLLMKALEYKQFQFIKMFLSNPKVQTFAGSREDFIAKIIRLSSSNEEEYAIMEYFRKRDFKFVSKHSICCIV